MGPDDAGSGNAMWARTRRAVAEFRQLLLCSKCSCLVSEPVYLGACEHMFCRSCAGPCAGSGCIVCHSPAWVKDLQINRQLSNITQLFCQLEALLNPRPLSPSPSIESSPQPTRGGAAKPKKNFKIWFSPRSSRIRCRVAKAADEAPQALSASKRIPLPIPPCGVSVPKDLSVFNFTSSSQDSSSSHHHDNSSADKKRRRVTKKKSMVKVSGADQSCQPSKKLKKVVCKKKLEAINCQWGIKQGAESTGGEALGQGRPNRKVSFQCPAQCSTSVQGSEKDFQQGVDHQEPTASFQGEHRGDCGTAEAWTGEGTPPMACSLPDWQPSKQIRAQDNPDTLSTPKRPRRSPGRARPPGGRKQPQSAPLPPSREEQPGATASPRTPTVLKRNHKGETLLHLAAIKGDVPAVVQLLDQGADPNLKDHAGWTPLHEACNLGHLGVAKVLLQNGALLNAPGYQNDSPLHDAARNGHADVVRLLLEKGASQNVLNMFGLRPVDCAETAEARAILQAAADASDHRGTPLRSPGAACKSGGSSRREGPVTLLGSRLSRTQQERLTELARILGGRSTDCFCNSVTHIIVPDATMPTTMSCFHGVLSGCWILRFDWVLACLKAERWTGEGDYEAGDGPARSRVNRDDLLPPLFDGCFFFFLGSFQSPSKAELLELVKEGGGQVLARRPKPDSDVTQTLSAAAYHASPGSDQALCTQYILYDPLGLYKPDRVRLGKVWTAPSTWLLDCIAAFRLLPVPEP